MHDSPSGRDETRTPRHPIDGRADPSIEDLEIIVVRYEGRPDRCTVLPRNCPEAERVTTWLSADVDALVDLEEMR